MRRKKVLTDPGFLVLIGINAYLVYHYYHHPEIFTTLIWLYWSQSVLMGVFTFFDMLTVQKVRTDPANPAGALFKQDQAATKETTSNRPSAFFFLFHYGFFHVVYLVFISTMKRTGPFQWEFFKYFILAFLIGQIFTFIQHKVAQRQAKTDMGAMFFIPYLRIIPMHLTIILPSFLGIGNMGIFLILKSAADIVMYIATKPAQKGKEGDTAMLVSQQTMNM